MKIVFIGLLLGVGYPAALGLENKYIPPAQPEVTLQSLEEYTGSDDGIVPAHTLDQDGYRYRDGRNSRFKRALDYARPATFDDLYRESSDVTQNLPDSDFVGPSPDKIAVPSSGAVTIDRYQGPSPDRIVQYANSNPNVYQQPSRPAVQYVNPYQNPYFANQYQGQRPAAVQYANPNSNSYVGSRFGAPTFSVLQPYQQAQYRPNNGYRLRRAAQRPEF